MNLSFDHCREAGACVALGRSLEEHVTYLKQLITSDYQQAASSSDPRSFCPLSRPELENLADQLPLVKNSAELKTFPDKLRKGREFGFSPLFCPKMIDECCQQGIFPMSIDVDVRRFVFTPKIHVTRALTRLVDEAFPGVPVYEDGEGLFDVSHLSPKRKLAAKCNAFVNRESDIIDCFHLLHLQHGENWLCQRLRVCFMYMLLHPEEFKTKIILFAVRLRPEIDEKETLIAAEIGFAVADVYTSGTGAYCASGAGTLQLAALGQWCRRVGFKLWDLGMTMEYKEKFLKCVGVTRKKWMALVTARIADGRSATQSEITDSKKGINVLELIRTLSAPSVITESQPGIT